MISRLFSSYSIIGMFGIAALLSILAAHAVYAMWFISVWCFFAATLSVIVLLYLNRFSPPKESTHGMAF